MEQFRNIGIIGRTGSVRVLETVRRLKRYLIGRHLHVILEDRIAEMLPGHNLQTSSRKLLGEVCDLVIVVGGDGSMLGAARALAHHNVPVLGINRGNLGFLTDILPEQLESQISEVLAGNYTVEQRFLLETEVRRNGVPIGQGDALNDVVLHPGKSTRMIEFELFIDGQFVYRVTPCIFSVNHKSCVCCTRWIITFTRYAVTSWAGGAAWARITTNVA